MELVGKEYKKKKLNVRLAKPNTPTQGPQWLQSVHLQTGKSSVSCGEANVGSVVPFLGFLCGSAQGAERSRPWSLWALEETAAMRWSGQGSGMANGRTQSSGPRSVTSWITWNVSLNLSGPERGWLSN